MKEEKTPIPFGQAVVGKCSICGGLVVTPQVWHAVIPAPKTCTGCGAIASEQDLSAELPVIPMEKTKTVIMDGVSTGTMSVESMFNNDADHGTFITD